LNAAIKEAPAREIEVQFCAFHATKKLKDFRAGFLSQSVDFWHIGAK
jgi:hypothetical protein